MKKIFAFITIAVFIVAFTTAIIIISKTSDAKLKYTIIPKAHCYVNTYDEELTFTIDIYVNNLDCFFSKIALLDDANLQDEEQKIKLSCLKIEKYDDYLMIKKEKYYLLNYTFELRMTSDSLYKIEMPDATINLLYQNNEVILPIGSFTYSKVPYYGNNKNEIALVKMKPIVNSLFNSKSLAAVVMGIKNNSNHEVTITTINFMNYPIFPDVSSIKEVSEEIYPSTNISLLLGNEYDVEEWETSVDELNITLAPNTTITLLVPLKYIQRTIVERTGLEINYTITNRNEAFYYDDFTFFQNMVIESDSLNIYNYD